MPETLTILLLWMEQVTPSPSYAEHYCNDAIKKADSHITSARKLCITCGSIPQGLSE